MRSKRIWRRSSTLVVLLVGLGVLSCDRNAVSVEESPGSILFHSPYPDPTEYTLIRDRLPVDEVLSLELSKLIGIDGGTIHLAGHTLTVPAGAVSSPTLFTLTLVPNGYVEVQLSAGVRSLLGGIADIGSLGFDAPVAVTLKYARSPDVVDESRLLIVQRHRDGRLTPVPSRVDPLTRTVTAELDHFSRYVIASN